MNESLSAQCLVPGGKEECGLGLVGLDLAGFLVDRQTWCCRCCKYGQESREEGGRTSERKKGGGKRKRGR